MFASVRLLDQSCNLITAFCILDRLVVSENICETHFCQ